MPGSQIPSNSENKPRGLYFSKALFEGLMFGGAYVRRGLCTEGNLSFKFDWAGLQWEGNLPFLLCFTLNSRQIPGTLLRGAYIQRGDLTEGFLRYDLGGLIFEGACTCKSLFSEFYGSRFPHVRESKTGFPFRHSGFHSMDSGFQVLYSSLCPWNLDPGFQSLVGFRIP